MEIFEILDRFELLNPGNENIESLRRAYTDQDLSSVFKLCDKEEYRKAILEQNIHSIFRIVENKRCIGEVEDLRKGRRSQEKNHDYGFYEEASEARHGRRCEIP